MSSTFLFLDCALIYCQVLLCVFVYVVTMPIHVHTECKLMNFVCKLIDISQLTNDLITIG